MDGLASGMFLVDGSGRLIHTNASGHMLLAEANVLGAPNGGFAQSTLTSGRRRQAGTSYAAAVALFVHKGGLDQKSPFETMAKLYGLTPAEMRVAFGNRERGRDACGGRDIWNCGAYCQDTAEEHFQKTGANRQADLVKLVAALASPLAAD